MIGLPPPPRPRRLSVGLVAAAVLGAGIFLVDALTPLDMAVAVLYVAVVLLVADSLRSDGILVVGGICLCLTWVAFFAVHGGSYDIEAIARCLVSMAAIVVTMLLTLRNLASRDALRSQAALLDLTHDAIIVRDASGAILYWNRGAEEVYGWSAEEAAGRIADELLQTRFPKDRAAIDAELADHARWDGELRRSRKDGAEVLVTSRWSAGRDGQDRLVAIMETNTDVTRRARFEHQLLEAQAELSHVARLSTLGQLTASIAHEVNQPLAAVVTNGEACLRWLRRPEPDVGEALASVERIIASGRRASDVVARLRALSRRAEPVHEALAIDELIGETTALIERELSRHGVALYLSLAADAPRVRGDKVQLQQVLINLAMNAMQAMSRSTAQRRLTFRARGEVGDDDRLRALIEVRDNGSGMDASEFPKLFEAFYTSKPDGMGLGLSICRSIVEAHGGRIDAMANADQGMTFRITLPALED